MGVRRERQAGVEADHGDVEVKAGGGQLIGHGR
jgi:hypothetical protein